jgi:hypothetical protein
MIITSLLGTFSINSSEKDHDKLIVRSKEKESLMRIFDSKRIIQCELDCSSYFVTLCKQEFAHSLIMMVKEVNYSDFKELQSEINLA